MLKFTVSKTFAKSTPESVEHGEYDEQGYVYEAETLTFRDLVYELRECIYLSSSHVDERTWATTRAVENYRDGSFTETSIHVNAINGKQPTAHQLRRIFAAAGLREGKC